MNLYKISLFVNLGVLYNLKYIIHLKYYILISSTDKTELISSFLCCVFPWNSINNIVHIGTVVLNTTIIDHFLKLGCFKSLHEVFDSNKVLSSNENIGFSCFTSHLFNLICQAT